MTDSFGDGWFPDEDRRIRVPAFDDREVSVRVADLTLDTLMPRTADTSAARLLRFSCGDREVVVTVTTSRQSVALSIRVVPAAPVGIDVRPLHGSARRVWAGDDGRAHCRGLPFGPMSLVVRWPASAGGPVRTAWTQL